MDTTPHDFVMDRPTGSEQVTRYYWVLFCRKCGYIAAYGNDLNEKRDQRQANIPKSCIGVPIEGGHKL